MPRGATATILFTDLVGSTDLLARLGEAGFDELRRAHFAALRGAVEHAGGNEIKTLGDGMLAVFPSAAEAVACAVAVQQATDTQARTGPAPVAVRVGLVLLGGEPGIGKTRLAAEQAAPGARRRRHRSGRAVRRGPRPRGGGMKFVSGQAGGGEGQRRERARLAGQGDGQLAALGSQRCLQLAPEGADQLVFESFEPELQALLDGVEITFEEHEIVFGRHVGPAHRGKVLHQCGGRLVAEHLFEAKRELVTRSLIKNRRHSSGPEGEESS